MRKTVRLLSAVGPVERLGRSIVTLPPPVQQTLAQVADREDLPLVAGSWHDDGSGCLVANALACLALARGGSDRVGVRGDDDRVDRTLDLRMLDAFPQLSSRDMNLLIVAWDEAAAQAAARTDVALRALLRAGLAWAGVGPAAPPPGGDGDDAAVDAVAYGVPTA
ncbi:MAG: hypothetical protein KY460_04355 [Actinobacteria bacterium]|nr:hypothetical protein [Actinomycetota bacterium]